MAPGRQILRVFAGGARLFLLVLAFSVVGCGFGLGRHDDDNRGRHGPMGCQHVQLCEDSTHWDIGECRCVKNEKFDAGNHEAVDGPSFDMGTDAKEGDDGSQGLD